MMLAAILVLAAGTYGFRLAGPMLRRRTTLSPELERLLAVATATILAALAATSAVWSGADFAGWARPAGVITGVVLSARRAPFPAVVVGAATVTAVLRQFGIS
jgi:branched-subunit amino acid transport protein